MATVGSTPDSTLWVQSAVTQQPAYNTGRELPSASLWEAAATKALTGLPETATAAHQGACVYSAPEYGRAKLHGGPTTSGSSSIYDMESSLLPILGKAAPPGCYGNGFTCDNAWNRYASYHQPSTAATAANVQLGVAATYKNQKGESSPRMPRVVNGSIVWGHHRPLSSDPTRMFEPDTSYQRDRPGHGASFTPMPPPAGTRLVQTARSTTTANSRAASLAAHFDLHQYLGKDAKGFGGRIQKHERVADTTVAPSQELACAPSTASRVRNARGANGESQSDSVAGRARPSNGVSSWVAASIGAGGIPARQYGQAPGMLLCNAPASTGRAQGHHPLAELLPALSDMQGLTVPSSRAEAIATSTWLKRRLVAMQENGAREETPAADGLESPPVQVDKLRGELQLLDEAFIEMVRQVGIHCLERGKLLETIRRRHLEVFRELLDARATDLQKAMDHYEELLKNTRQKSKAAILFSRAALHGKHNTEGGGPEDAGMDLLASQAHCRILTSQLKEVRSKLDEASHQLGQTPTVMSLLLQVDSLSSDDQKLLVYHLLTAKTPEKTPLEQAQPNLSAGPTSLLLGCTDAEEVAGLLSVLLSHLSPRDRVAAIALLVPIATANDAAELPAALAALLHNSCDPKQGSATATAVASLFSKVKQLPHEALPQSDLDFGTKSDLPGPLSSARRYELAKSVVERLKEPLSTTAPELMRALGDDSSGRSSRQQPRTDEATMAAEISRLQAVVARQREQISTFASSEALASGVEKLDSLTIASDHQDFSPGGKPPDIHGGAADGASSLQAQLDESTASAALLRMESANLLGEAGAEFARLGAHEEAAVFRAHARSVAEGNMAEGPSTSNMGQKRATALAFSTAALKSYRLQLIDANRRISELEAMLRKRGAETSTASPALRSGTSRGGGFGQDEGRGGLGRSHTDGTDGDRVLGGADACDEGDSYDGKTLGSRAKGGGTFASKHCHDNVAAAGQGGKGHRAKTVPAAKAKPSSTATSPETGQAAGGRRGRKASFRGATEPNAIDDDDDIPSEDDPDEQLQANGDRWPSGRGLKAEFGGLMLRTSGARAMGLHFLYRLAAQTLQGKIAMDRAGLSKGAPPEPLPSFLVQTMVAQYGMADLAQTYLCEMFRGLAKYRHASLRLQTFAACTGLFPSETMPLTQLSFMLDVFSAIAELMDSERALTCIRYDQVFLRLGEVNELYMPVTYVVRGIERALQHEHPDVANVLGAKMDAFVQANTRTNVTSCETGQLTTSLGHARVHVIGAAKAGRSGFVHVDRVLSELWTQHLAFHEQRNAKARRVFSAFDANGDAKLSRDEFEQMITAIDPRMCDSEMDELWRASGGKEAVDSAVDLKALEERLFLISHLHKTATQSVERSQGGRGASSKNLVTAAAAQVAREELGVLVALWDSVRDAPQEAQHIMSTLISHCKWTTIVQLKFALRGWVLRSRQRRKGGT